MAANEMVNGLDDWEALGFKDAPRRVVSLVPSVTESLFELGVGDRLVAATNFCVHPAEKLVGLPRVGGTKSPDLKKIAAAQPDLVITNHEENRKEDVEALRAAGLKVWVTFPRTVRGAIGLLWDIVRLFRVPQMGQRLSVLETAYEWTSLAAENAEPVKVFCPIWREALAAEGRPRWWMTFNGETYAHDVLRVCGGANVFAGRGRLYPLAADLGRAPAHAPVPDRDDRYPRVTPAEVAERAPEVILLPSETFPFTEADVSAFDGFQEIPAVKDKRIYLVDGSLVTWHGTRLARALMELPAYLLRAGSLTEAGGPEPDAA